MLLTDVNSQSEYTCNSIIVPLTTDNEEILIIKVLTNSYRSRQLTVNRCNHFFT